MSAFLTAMGIVAFLAVVFALDSVLTVRQKICSPAKERFPDGKAPGTPLFRCDK